MDAMPRGCGGWALADRRPHSPARGLAFDRAGHRANRPISRATRLALPERLQSANEAYSALCLSWSPFVFESQVGCRGRGGKGRPISSRVTVEVEDGRDRDDRIFELEELEASVTSSIIIAHCRNILYYKLLWMQMPKPNTAPISPTAQKAAELLGLIDPRRAVGAEHDRAGAGGNGQGFLARCCPPGGKGDMTVSLGCRFRNPTTILGRSAILRKMTNGLTTRLPPNGGQMLCLRGAPSSERGR